MLTTAVNCDECGELFGMKNYEVKREGTDVIEHRFDCPHCNYSYLSYLTTGKIRRNQDRIQTLRRHIRVFKSRGSKQKALKEIEALIKENGELMDELKDSNGKWLQT